MIRAQTHSLEGLSKHDRYGVETASRAPFQTLSEWEAYLADRFCAPNRSDLSHEWWVSRDKDTVYLRHPFLFTVLQVSQS